MDYINLTECSYEERERYREEQIKSHENFILWTASKCSKKFISKSDDEWSIALCAFSEALDTFDESKGEFKAYAKLLIQRSLIDYFRNQSKFKNETSISFQTLENNTNTTLEDFGSPGMESLQVLDKTSLQEEIEALTDELKAFDISFMQLTSCSPKQAKTKEECRKAVRFIVDDKERYTELMRSKQLPIGELVVKTGVSRKTLDRYRKYIIMAAIVLQGGYPEISEYLQFMKGGQ